MPRLVGKVFEAQLPVVASLGTENASVLKSSPTNIAESGTCIIWDTHILVELRRT